MNKVLNILKYIFLMFLIATQVLAYNNDKLCMLGLNHYIFLFLIAIFILLSIKDIKNKNIINNNKMYNFLCIMVFLIIIVVYIRALYDPHFFYNNSQLVKELDTYSYELYGVNYAQDDWYFINLYIAQNINYFLVMFGLLFGYRFINKSKECKKLIKN